MVKFEYKIPELHAHVRPYSPIGQRNAMDLYGKPP